MSHSEDATISADEKELKKLTSDESTTNDLIEHFTEAVLENVFITTAFKVHRERAVNKLAGLEVEIKTEIADEDAEEGPSSPSRNTRGKGSINWRNRNADCKCKCFVCHRMIAAVRFAPHLEKCIGIGRAARTRRRNAPAIDAFVIPTAYSRTTRSSALRAATKVTSSSPSTSVNKFEEVPLKDVIKEEQMEEGEGEEPLRERLRNKTKASTAIKK